MDQVETSDICTMYEEQNENCLASEMNCDIMTCNIGDGQNTTESINVVTHESRKSYERRKEKNMGKKSEEEVHNYDDDDVIVGEFNEEVYKKFCHSKHCDDELMKKLVEVLHDNSSLEDFLALITQLADGIIDPMNMAFLLCLDVAKLQKLQMTTSMRFRVENKQFWEVVYRVCHGKGLRLFSGSKSLGSFQSGHTTGRKYNPKESCHNFAVPNENSLR